MNKIFVTGISTEVGKTIASAILVESLKADYWKPIQSGDLDNSDTDKVKSLISNSISNFHPNSYSLNTPMSPHAAAEIDNVKISLNKIIEPATNNNLVIEGAGGLYVPLNNKNCIIELIKEEYKVVLVSRHYLGSINHTMMSIESMKQRGINILGIIFSGNEHKSTESIILKMSELPMIGRINEEESFDKEIIKKYSSAFSEQLNTLLNNA